MPYLGEATVVVAKHGLAWLRLGRSRGGPQFGFEISPLHHHSQGGAANQEMVTQEQGKNDENDHENHLDRGRDLPITKEGRNEDGQRKMEQIDP